MSEANASQPTDDDPMRTATYLRGLRNGYAEAAKSLDLSRSEIRLAAGEMTAQEMRSVLAVLGWRKRNLEQMAANVRVDTRALQSTHHVLPRRSLNAPMPDGVAPPRAETARHPLVIDPVTRLVRPATQADIHRMEAICLAYEAVVENARLIVEKDKVFKESLSHAR